MTREQILALTDADVTTAKQRAAVNRVTREGLSAVDEILADVGSHSFKTLEDAKAFLLRHVTLLRHVILRRVTDLEVGDQVRLFDRRLWVVHAISTRLQVNKVQVTFQHPSDGLVEVKLGLDDLVRIG